MSAKVLSAAVLGLDCEFVEVEADTTMALPGIFIVGLPDKAVDESRERVRSAIKNSGLEVPRTKVTINLAPADLKKQGPSYDFPIAISTLIATKQLPPMSNWDKQLFIGELALDAQLRSVTGILSICLAAKKAGITNVFVPSANAAEASLVDDITIYACTNLRQVVDHLKNKSPISPYQPTQNNIAEDFSDETSDMKFIKGQQHVKRALEIAAAGGHNILMSGPPGSGKTLLAKSMATVLPQMTKHESLDVTRIYSVAGNLPSNQPLINIRPFRAPHHTASGVALVGGGAWPKPGEISLAHRGILFLDEFPEFPRMVLENLRQPLEDGIICVSRAQGTIHFPAKFMLVAAMNPCPCGYLNDTDKQCICLPAQIIKYQKKISGPLLDRIDLHVEVPKVKFEKLTDNEEAESSNSIRARVQQARLIQTKRFVGSNVVTNAEMSSRLTLQHCEVDEKTMTLLKQAVNKIGLSARSYFRVLKLARTIADLAEQEKVSFEHVAEALRYRPRVD